MNKQEIIKKLKILGINKSDQLLNNNLFYWYFEVCKTNKGNNKKLIEINLAKEELDKLTTQELINVLDKKIAKENNAKSESSLSNIIPYETKEEDEEDYDLEEAFDKFFRGYRGYEDDEENYDLEEEEEEDYDLEEEEEEDYDLEEEEEEDYDLEEEEDMIDDFENPNPNNLHNYNLIAEHYHNLEEYDKALYFYTTYNVNYSDLDFDELSKIEKKMNKLADLNQLDNEYLELEEKYKEMANEFYSHQNWYNFENAYDMSIEICKLMNIEPSENYFNCGVLNEQFKHYEFAIKCYKKAIFLNSKKEYIDRLEKLIEEKKSKILMSQDILELVIELKVCSIVSEVLSVEVEEVKSSSNFQDDLGADSLDTVELVIALEEAFKIEIPDQIAEGILTIDDAVKFIKEKKFNQAC